MIDLHTHTNASDGTYTPQELVNEAVSLGLYALAITDHDTFAGYHVARPLAQAAGLRLICGIELSTTYPTPQKPDGKTIHVLAYWPTGEPHEDFCAWIRELQESRRDRNRRLIARLRELGVNITLEEVEAIGGSITARPHFARVLIEKGYVDTISSAFTRYLGECAPGFVQRDSAPIAESLQRIQQSGGVSSLAHPVRLGNLTHAEERALVQELVELGLQGIEVHHSDHQPEDRIRYAQYAEEFGLLATGGSDFHGANKPNIRLGSGKSGNVAVPDEMADALYALRSEYLHQS